MSTTVLVHVSKEMIAAGVDAMDAAKKQSLTDAELVQEIYLAMYGTGLMSEKPELVH